MTESPTARSFKAKINNYARKYGLPSQVVLQNYMFERFLERLSLSEYRNKFVIKGGILISVLVGLQTRSTMDLDATDSLYGVTTPKRYSQKKRKVFCLAAF